MTEGIKRRKHCDSKHVTRLLAPGQTSIFTRNEHITNAKWAQTIAGILLISICIYEYITPSRASRAEKAAYRIDHSRKYHNIP